MDQSTDVVQEHRNRNRQPRPPNEAALSSSREGLDQHLRALDGRCRTGHTVMPSEVEPSTPEAPASSRAPVQAPSNHHRASRNSINPPTDSNASGAMLRYYRPDWQAVLKNAKNLYRFWLATKIAYPSSVQGYREANESIQEAIAHFKLEGGVLNGTSSVL
jgi:hypothetical protein